MTSCAHAHTLLVTLFLQSIQNTLAAFCVQHFQMFCSYFKVSTVSFPGMGLIEKMRLHCNVYRKWIHYMNISLYEIWNTAAFGCTMTPHRVNSPPVSQPHTHTRDSHGTLHFISLCLSTQTYTHIHTNVCAHTHAYTHAHALEHKCICTHIHIAHSHENTEISKHTHFKCCIWLHQLNYSYKILKYSEVQHFTDIWEYREHRLWS